MAFAGRKRLTVFIWSVAFLITLSGCEFISYIKLPSDKDYEKINAGKCTLVLFRVTADLDGRPFEVFSPSLPDRVHIGIGGFKTGGQTGAIAELFLSEQTKQEGWAYLLLEPGLYYLDIPDHDSTPQLFRFDIPVNARVVYIGTFHLRGKEEKISYGIWGTKTFGNYNNAEIVVKNEPELAEKIAAEFFPQWGSPVNSLGERHTGPIILRTPPASPP
jgi:hypothetical protein